MTYIEEVIWETVIDGEVTTAEKDYQINPRFVKKSYSERLKALNMPTLKYR